MKYRDIRRFLIKKGWEHLRTVGSHETWQSPDGTVKQTVPNHREVSPGIVAQIIKKLPDAPREWR